MIKTKNIDEMDVKEMHQLILKLQEDNVKLIQLQNGLMESRNRYCDLYNFAPAGYITMDTNGIIIDANLTSTELLGVRMKDFIGEAITKFITEDSQEVYKTHVKDLAEQKTRQACIVKMKPKNEDILYVRLESDYVPVDNGVYKQFCVFLNVTKCKRFEEDLKRSVEALTKSNTELERFSYVASHDLREPLHSISSCTQLLNIKYSNILDEKGQELIDYILSAAGKMNDLIIDLLFYSNQRNNYGFFTYVDMVGILNYVLGNLQKLILETNSCITTGHLPVIYADSTQIAQVFQNLISNAIKHHNGIDIKIHISAELKGSYWLFSVKDNGGGIEKEYLEKIFEIFKRLEPSTKSSGTGVGLAICKQVIEKHNGCIWAESNPGEGSTFYFTLPVKKV